MRQLSTFVEDPVMRRGQSVSGALCVVLMALAVCRSAAQTPHVDPEDMASPDVYVRTLLVQDELKLIRLEMGKPQDTRRELRVTEAEPREVFFQAPTLFHKANRLSFDLTRERAELPEKPVGTPRQKRVPGQYEPRDPYPHERHHGDDGTDPRYRAHSRATGLERLRPDLLAFGADEARQEGSR